MSVSLKPPSFIEQQYRFTAYIRDPEVNQVPDKLEKRRIDLYRELIVNNIESFLSASFPVLRGILDDRSWAAMVQDFFARHRCQTPYFSGIAEEFLEYLQKQRGERREDFPFLLELAHYEWVEVALALAADEDLSQDRGDLSADSLAHSYRLSNLAWPLLYRYPVHRISQTFKPEEAPRQPTFLVVYRNLEDQIKFMEINAVTYRFLQILDANRDQPAEDCLIQLTQEMPGLDHNSIFEYAGPMLQNLWLRGIVYRANS